MERHEIAGARRGVRENPFVEHVVSVEIFSGIEGAAAVNILTERVLHEAVGEHEHRAEDDVLVRQHDADERIGDVGAIDLEIPVEVADLAAAGGVVGRVVEGLEV